MINIGISCNDIADRQTLRKILRNYTFLQTKRIKIYTIEYADQVLEKDIMICFIDFQNY